MRVPDSSRHPHGPVREVPGAAGQGLVVLREPLGAVPGLDRGASETSRALYFGHLVSIFNFAIEDKRITT
ncbi:hypothetical protein, partial [Haloechinothrix alba]|uniref:hypothetical protein n=1 Tax=Haloechinothrix alba TaxID=664784 RepID=UPI001131E773